MSTRSTIAYVEEGRNVVASFCHMDGYLDHTGRILFDHYNSFEQAKELVDIGAISFLETTTALIRERSRCLNDRKPEFYRTISSFMYHLDPLNIEYVYLWQKKMWWIARRLAIDTTELKYEEGYEQWVYYHSKFEPLAQELYQWDFDNTPNAETWWNLETNKGNVSSGGGGA